MKIKLLGIDLAKNVFQLCALNQASKVLFNRTVRRAQLRSTIAKLQHSTALANQIRSLGREYGVIFPAGIKSLIKRLPEALEDGSNELSPVARYALADQHRCLLEVRQAMATFLQQIEQLATQHPAYISLLPLPGIGPMIASAYIAAIGNGHQFKCGRQVSAWLGLVPRQHGTGGKIQLKSVTKNGDRYLRTLMIHGARAVITRGLKNRPELAQWVQPIIDRQGFNKAVVALANKLTRISWVIVTTGEPFDMKQAFKPAA